MVVTFVFSEAGNGQQGSSVTTEAVQVDESAPVSENTDTTMSDQKNVPADSSGVSDENGDDVPECSPFPPCSKISGAEAVITASWGEVKRKFKDF